MGTSNLPSWDLAGRARGAGGRRLVAVVLVGAATAASLGSCATSYDKAAEKACCLYYAGKYDEAAAEFERLKAENSQSGTLIDLELGMVEFAAGKHDESSRHLESAGAEIEVIDFTTDNLEGLGEHVFSEASGPFRARPYEKVFLCVLNLLNYAAQGRLDRARTEANLLYSTVDGIENLERTTKFSAPLVYLLVGLIDEITQPNRPGQALISYRKAEELQPSPELERVIESLQARDSGRAAPPSDPSGKGELVAFVLNGRGPALREIRVEELSEDEKRYYQDVLVADAILKLATAIGSQALAEEKFLPVAAAYLARPQIKLAGPVKRDSAYSEAALVVGGSELGPCGRALDLERQILDWFDGVRGRLVRAALVRAMVRAVAALAAQKGLEESMKDSKMDPQLKSFLAQLGGMAVREALYAADIPDTRGWSLLPRDVFFRRASLDPGEHEVSIRLSGPGGAKQLPARKLTIRPGEMTFGVWICHD